jgi:hypothetical protein
MITIKIPGNFIQEKKYIIDILFGEFLGLQYTTSITQEKHYEIIFNGNKILINDAFFSEINEESGYLYEKYLPRIIKKANNQFTTESDLIVLYGNTNLIINENEIKCEIDIFASAFFMLSRWEEHVNKTRDHHNRFPSIESIAYKNNFLHRPIVNEYLEMLWNMLSFLGIKQLRKKREFEIHVTHDVDHINYWKNYKQIVREIGRDLIIEKNVKAAFFRTFEYIQVKRNVLKDPYDTFDEIMSISEQFNLKSKFYFLCGGETKVDNNFDINGKKAKDLLVRIKERNHSIAIHPSFNSYNNIDLLQKELHVLSSITGMEVTESRQHYLRFEVPNTWILLDKTGIEIDSTLGYADHPGFRAGTCYQFSVFDILNRKKLKLKESPLLAMEVTFIQYEKLVPDMVEQNIKNLIDITKKYNGDFVLLWHNSSFNRSIWKNYQHLYKMIIEYAVKGD